MATKTKTYPPASKHQAALIAERLELDAQLKALEEQVAAVDAKLIKSIGVGNSVESELALVTPTTQTHTLISFEQLCEQRPVWARRVTKKVFDRTKFNHLVKANAIPADVQEMISYRDTDPFLRITLR